MSYITNSDIEQRLGTSSYIQLTDDEGTGSANEARVDEARLGAEGEANSYLARRYAVPVDLSAHAELQAVLKSFVLDLAEYRLHARRPPIPSDVVRRREQAVTWLRRVAAGQVHLPAETPVDENPAIGQIGQVTGQKRLFDRDELRGL
ncbi:MAG: gp436 family protein [Phycisphaerae bacterium]